MTDRIDTGFARVVLIGYRAAGKSTVGQRLAVVLGWRYLDVDRGIEQRGGDTIRAIYEQQGWRAYRAIETAVTTAMCTERQCVISFGAGTIMTEANRNALQSDSLVVYLRADARELWRRIESDPASAATRPPLSRGGYQEVVEILNERAPVYEQRADLTLDATLPVDQIVQRIIRNGLRTRGS